PLGSEALLLTVTLTVELARLCEVSRATAFTVCGPLLTSRLSHVTEYGPLVSSAPTFTPSTWNCTPATPVSSDAFADNVTVPLTVLPLAGDVTETTGGCPSPPPPVMVTLSKVPVALVPATWLLTARPTETVLGLELVS